MHLPLDEWDPAYLHVIAHPGEKADLEKKASAAFDIADGTRKRRTREELAKQVCAFANSGTGYVVYGIADGGGLDVGVAETIGRQPIKAWVEAEIPKMHDPAVLRSEARFIRDPGHHAAGRRVLVVFVPLSPSRPHVIPGAPGKAYLRGGEHSFEMSLQTLLDISSRGNAPHAAIDGLGKISMGRVTSDKPRTVTYYIRPKVRLVSGPVCHEWGLELRVAPEIGRFQTGGNANAKPDFPNHLFIRGEQPLFPGRSTRVVDAPLAFDILMPLDNAQIVATLYAGAAPPARECYTVQSFIGSPVEVG